MHPVRTLLAIIFVSLPASLLYADGLRTWRSLNGNFSVDAELVNVAEGKVELRKADGSTLKVDIKQLSLADVKYVNDSLAAATSAFNSSTAKIPDMKSGDREDNDASAASQGDESGSSSGSLIPEESDEDKLPDWDIDPASLASSEGALGIARMNFVVQSKSSSQIIFPVVPSRNIGVYVGSQERTLSVYDLKSPKPKSRAKITDEITSGRDIALSPDGKKCAYFYGRPAKLTMIQSSTGKRLWEAAVPARTTVLLETKFLSANRIAVASKSNKQIYIYDVDSGELTLTIDLKSNRPSEMIAAVSPSGTLIASLLEDSILGLSDTTTDKAVTLMALRIGDASQESKVNSVIAASFCRDGKELVVMAKGRGVHLLCFSMKTGRMIHRFEIDSTVADTIEDIRENGWPSIEATTNGKGWLIRGVAFVSREDGSVLWQDDERSYTERHYRLASNDSRLELRKEGMNVIGSVKPISLRKAPAKKTGGQNAVVIEQDKQPAKANAMKKEKSPKQENVETDGIVQEAENVQGSDLTNVPFIEVPTLLPVFKGQRVAAAPLIRPNSIPFQSDDKGSFDFMTAPKRPEKVFAMSRDLSVKGKVTIVPLDAKASKGGKAYTINGERLDCSPDGAQLVCISNDESASVHVLNSVTGRTVVKFVPPGETGPSKRRSAIFLENDLLLTMSGDQAVAWRLPKLEAVYQFTIRGIGLGSAYRFPTSDRFIHEAEDKLHIRNTKTGVIEGQLERFTRETSIINSLDIRSDESALAILYFNPAGLTIQVWDLTDGSKTKTFPVEGVQHLQWCDEGRLLFYNEVSRESLKFRNDPLRVSHQSISLFDISKTQLVWKYWTPFGSNKWIPYDKTPDGQIRTQQFRSSGTANVLNIIGIPGAQSAKAIKEAKPGEPLLKSGDTVGLVINVRVSGDDFANSTIKEQAEKTVKELLAKDQITIADRSALKLTITIGNYITGKAMEAMLSNLKSEIVWAVEGKRKIQSGINRRDPPSQISWEEIDGFLNDVIGKDKIVDSAISNNANESILSLAGEEMLTREAFGR
jgi:WD40 repeat protein